jgi:hypothetical protein
MKLATYTPPHALTRAELCDARRWIADALNAPAHLSDREVEVAVRRHYAGGIAAFVTDWQGDNHGDLLALARAEDDGMIAVIA